MKITIRRKLVESLEKLSSSAALDSFGIDMLNFNRYGRVAVS